MATRANCVEGNQVSHSDLARPFMAFGRSPLSEGARHARTCGKHPAVTTQAFQQFHPRVHARAYIHPSAFLIGEVEIGEEASVWPLSVLRGDNGAIVLGARSNLQDGVIVHATTGLSQTTVGAEVTVGHRVTLHGCTVKDRCLIGMGSTLLDNVVVGEGSFVAAGSLLTPNKVFEPRSFIIGSPAKRLREVKASELEAIAHGWRAYVDLARIYRQTQSP